MHDHPSGHETSRRLALGAGIAIGMGVGVALGVALDNMGLGIGLGLAIGVVISAAPEWLGSLQRRRSAPEDQEPDDASEVAPDADHDDGADDVEDEPRP
ncbi:hypothetical protein [Microbacterium esteraromaticum]|uniref:hypothetical protein n=1 Tax=Microbacterium esteraromaticum TaxID=57043 RepID=UPI0019D3C306|nr:hypothetical protein [Microbacterium esteraromaticum]MBN7794498.1 hypothetical protein [Microbacterium esteraromaticum]